MKKLTFVLLTCFFTSAFGQEITFTELKNGVSDFDSFIVEMTQKDFAIFHREEFPSTILTMLGHKKIIAWPEAFDEPVVQTVVVSVSWNPNTKIGKISLKFDNIPSLYNDITKEIKLNCEKLKIKYSEVNYLDDEGKPADLKHYTNYYKCPESDIFFTFSLQHVEGKYGIEYTFYNISVDNDVSYTHGE